jgi:tetratricopeptide (TPR) repeat protein
MRGLMGPFTPGLARLIGRGEFDAAIAYLAKYLKGNASDVYALEIIALCHRWLGRHRDALVVARRALAFDPASFTLHNLAAELLAEANEDETAAFHARKMLECFPEPLPPLPKVVNAFFTLLARYFPRWREAHPGKGYEHIQQTNAEKFDWAKNYLSWYDATYGETFQPSKH